MLDWQVATCVGDGCLLAVAGGVFGGVFWCCLFSHQMSWMRSGT